MRAPQIAVARHIDLVKVGLRHADRVSAVCPVIVRQAERLFKDSFAQIPDVDVSIQLTDIESLQTIFFMKLSKGSGV